MLRLGLLLQKSTASNNLPGRVFTFAAEASVERICGQSLAWLRYTRGPSDEIDIQRSYDRYRRHCGLCGRSCVVEYKAVRVIMLKFLWLGLRSSFIDPQS